MCLCFTVLAGRKKVLGERSGGLTFKGIVSTVHLRTKEEYDERAQPELFNMNRRRLRTNSISRTAKPVVSASLLDDSDSLFANAEVDPSSAE